MKIEYRDFKSVLFPDGELFFITGEFLDDVLVISIPEFYGDKIKAEFKNLQADDFINSDMGDEITGKISSLLNVDRSAVSIRVSIDYKYPFHEINLAADNSAVYNGDFDFSLYENMKGNDPKILNIFRNYPHCTAVIADGMIVSFSCSDNGLISVETHPDHLNRGYGTQCVELLVSRLLQSGYQDGIFFPTGNDNLAARKVAEKLGFIQMSKGFWLSVNTDLENYDVDFIENYVEKPKDNSAK